ncbi:MAG: DUF533 domain-containing protein [Hyphomicrobium sp.]
MFDAKALLDQLARGAEQAKSAASADGTSGGGFADILAQIQKTASDASSSSGGLFGQVLGQAIEGLKDGATRIDQATGAGAALKQASGGQSAVDLAARVKQLAAENQLAAGAVLGGLGGLVLATGTGRSLATGAAKAGALALIGGLAYKAYQNHHAGKPLLGDAADTPAPAPTGSGFESAAVSNDTATRMIRAMIAAAAADGRIDDEERRRILGVMDQSGLGDEARQFLEREIAAPADSSEIAAGVTSPAVAAQIYTAARIAVGPGGGAEKSFLAGLARRLGITPALASEIDAAALASG